MTAVDTNVLVYAHRREVREHTAAKDIVTGLVEDGAAWAIPWPCLYEFFSIVTNASIWIKAASSPDEAARQIAAWCAAPGLRLITETEDFWPILERLLRNPRVRGPIVHDARIAALCLAHGVEALLTRDRDFSLFPSLVTRNPLA